MAHPRFLRHVTLTTGDVRDSTIDEISPAALEAVGELLVRVCRPEQPEPVSIPAVGPYSISGRCTSRCLTATVWADGPPSVAIASLGVAGHSRCGATLWRALHTWGDAPVSTDPARCPPEPWVAVALDAGIARHLDATAWLGDFARCLGWAFLVAAHP